MFKKVSIALLIATSVTLSACGKDGVPHPVDDSYHYPGKYPKTDV